MSVCVGVVRGEGERDASGVVGRGERRETEIGGGDNGITPADVRTAFVRTG